MIREANINDVDEITDLLLDTWETTYNNIFPKEVFEQRRNTRNNRIESIKIIIDTIYVYEEKGKILGQLSIIDARGYIDAGEVQSIYVLKEAQGKGIGKQLLNKAFDELRKKYNKIIIRCLKDNSSLEFYKYIGGTVINTEEIVVLNKKYIEEVIIYNFT